MTDTDYAAASAPNPAPAPASDVPPAAPVPASAAPPPAPSLRMPVKREWLSLPEPYSAFKVLMWVNYPGKLQRGLQGDAATAQQALGRILLEHNGWPAEDGTPLPPPSDPAFWDAVPQELSDALVILALTEPRKMAMSMAQRSRSGQ